ncbi:MAG: hypothetical protein QM534_18340 [Sediminibacterium sp.]|nr:hypothetical protein [Sediminibacterium sp.]
MRKDKIKILGLFIVFISMIFFPILNSTFNIVDDTARLENRRAKPRPEFDINFLDPYPKAYEDFYNDTFNLRNRIISIFNYYNIRILKKSPYPNQVLIGKEGWLFKTDSEMDSYTGKNALTKDEKILIQREMEYREAYLKARGCKFYILIAPNKASIYNDKFGKVIKRVSDKSYGEDLMDFLKTESKKLNVINVFNVLHRKKTEQLLFYKLDTHWSEHGAFFAYQELFKAIKKDLPSLSDPLNENEVVFKVDSTQVGTGNIQMLLGDNSYFKEYFLLTTIKKGAKSAIAAKANYPSPQWFPAVNYEAVRQTNDSTKPNVLVISDSFGNFIFPLISEHFMKSVKIFDAWSYKLNEDIVEKEKPSVVILLITESLIRNLTNKDNMSHLNSIKNTP